MKLPLALPLVIGVVMILLLDRRDPSRRQRRLAPFRNARALAVGAAAGLFGAAVTVASARSPIAVGLTAILWAAVITAIADLVIPRTR